MRRALLALVLLAGLAGTARAGSLYVSTTGGGSDPCSLAQPCSLAHGQTVAQGLIATGLTEALNIYLHGGTYTLATGLTFGAADSGTSNYPVTWQAYPGEVPVISGGQAIAGWVPDTGSIYKTYVGTDWNFRQLYVNGVHVPRTHGSFNPSGWTRTATGYTPPDDSMMSWGNPTDVEIVSLGPWSMDRCKVASLNGSGGGETTTHVFSSQDIIPEANDPLAYELGMQFTSDVAGQVTGLRFYRNQNIADTGTHDGHLWDAAGNLLATATFVASNATGWQDATLGTPVNISASTEYVVSFSSTVVTVTINFWPPAVDNDPLHAPTTNGVYSATPGTFPNNVSGNNYWVDVDFAFVPAGGPPNAITMATPCWTNQQSIQTGYDVRSTPSWVENAYELMASSYWYLDRTTGYLYYWPPSGSMTGVTVVAPVVDNLLTVTGASNLQFKDLVFAYSNWIGPDSSTGYVGIQSGYTWTTYNTVMALLDSAITVVGGSNITFSGDEFSHMGSRVMLVKSGSSNVSITGNRFDDNAGGIIQIGDTSGCIYGCSPNTPESGVIFTGNRVAVGNEFDYIDNGAIYAVSMTGSTIANNEIDGTPWVPIAIGWVDAALATNNTIANNYVNGPCIGPAPLGWDCGGIYAMAPQSLSGTYASGLQVLGNYIRGISPIGLYVDVYSAWETWISNVVQNAYNVWLEISPANGSANHIQVLGTYTDMSNILNDGTNITISGTSTISSGTQPFGTPAQAIICGAGIPGATACTTPTTWPTWQSGVGATYSRPQIGP